MLVQAHSLLFACCLRGFKLLKLFLLQRVMPSRASSGGSSSASAEAQEECDITGVAKQ